MKQNIEEHEGKQKQNEGEVRRLDNKTTVQVFGSSW